MDNSPNYPYGDPYGDPYGSPEQPEQPYLPSFDPQPPLTQKQWELLLEQFGIPEDVKKRYWSLINHHLQLGKIQNQHDLVIHLVQIENIIRISSWDDSQPALSPAEAQQILFFVNWLIRKSYEGGTPNERVNLISQYSNISRRTEDVPNLPERTGILSRLLPRRGR